jgi:hypothetical protein
MHEYNNSNKDLFITMNKYFNMDPIGIIQNPDRVNNIMRGEMNRRYSSPKIMLRNMKSNKMNMTRDQDRFVSSLTGQKVNLEEFIQDNNIKPYFGGKLKQNIENNAYESRLESFTGVEKNKKGKKEQNPFTDLHRNINDYEPAYLTEFNRMEKSKMQNNVLPSQQIKVGQGYNRDNKYDSEPNGGFHQSDLLYDANVFKSVDDLRVKTNPKVSYDGVVVEGHKEFKRGEVKHLSKNSIETFYQKNEDHLFKTTGAVTKNTVRSCEDVKRTARQETTQEYKGTSFNANKSIYKEFKSSGPVKKSGLKEYGYRNVSIVNNGKDIKDDYGKKNFKVYDNERDVTSELTRVGNISSFIKSLITPIQDILKPTSKEYLINNARSFSGNINGPNRQTVHDPNGVARTTIKETTIHDSTTGNLKVNSENIIYDPSVVAKTTIREVLENYNNDVNLQGSIKPTVYDPNDISRTTVREITEDSNRDGNVASQLQHGDGYRNSDFNAKNTNKEMSSDNDYYGMPETENADGYKVSKFKAETTHKELLSDNDYIGVSKNEVVKPLSYDSIYNAVINDINEGLLEEREPTKSSTKLANGKDAIKITKERNDCNMKNYRTVNNKNKITSVTPNQYFINFNSKTDEIKTDRLDPNLLNAYVNNPYTQSLQSAV